MTFCNANYVKNQAHESSVQCAELHMLKTRLMSLLSSVLNYRQIPTYV